MSAIKAFLHHGGPFDGRRTEYNPMEEFEFQMLEMPDDDEEYEYAYYKPLCLDRDGVYHMCFKCMQKKSRYTEDHDEVQG